MKVPGDAVGNVALMFFAIIAALVTIEAFLHLALPSLGYHFPWPRVTDDQFDRRAGRAYDNAHGVRYSFDDGGFRTSGAAAGAVRTVLFLGDSFTQGFGVDASDTFPAVACARLATLGISARCLNAGTEGFGTAHELRLLRRLLQRDELAIDAVVFQVLPNNDLRDNWEDGGFRLEEGNLAARDPPDIPSRVWWRDVLLGNFLARRSRLVALIANASFDGGGMDPHYDAAAFALERRLLEEAVSTARARNVPIVIVVVATAWELEGKASQPYDEHARLDFVASTVPELHVPWIDSRELGLAAADYIPDDGHFSVSGNTVMGDTVAARLVAVLRDEHAGWSERGAAGRILPSPNGKVPGGSPDGDAARGGPAASRRRRRGAAPPACAPLELRARHDPDAVPLENPGVSLVVGEDRRAGAEDVLV